jgi:hypothetical protein
MKTVMPAAYRATVAGAGGAVHITLQVRARRRTMGRKEVAMTPERERRYRWLFLTGAVYDIGLGIVFLFFAGWAFDLLDIRDEMPDGGYVPLIGAFLLVIGIAYWFVYRGDLVENRDLIAVGTLYKAAYSGVGFWVWAFGEVPHVAFVAVFGVADLVFFLLMLDCWLVVRREHARRVATHLTSG